MTFWVTRKKKKKTSAVCESTGSETTDLRPSLVSLCLSSDTFSMKGKKKERSRKLVLHRAAVQQRRSFHRGKRDSLPLGTFTAALSIGDLQTANTRFSSSFKAAKHFKFMTHTNVQSYSFTQLFPTTFLYSFYALFSFNLFHLGLSNLRRFRCCLTWSIRFISSLIPFFPFLALSMQTVFWYLPSYENCFAVLHTAS